MMMRVIAAAIGISAVAIMGASLAPAWADADATKTAAMFGSNGALGSLDLVGIRSGFGPGPGSGDEEELRRQRQNASETDPLKGNRDGNPLPKRSDLNAPFAANLNANGAPIGQQPVQNPPAATNPPPANNPPVATNPPANNPPPVQNSTSLASTIANSVISSAPSATVIVSTVLRQNDALQ